MENETVEIENTPKIEMKDRLSKAWSKSKKYVIIGGTALGAFALGAISEHTRRNREIENLEWIPGVPDDSVDITTLEDGSILISEVSHTEDED